MLERVRPWLRETRALWGLNGSEEGCGGGPNVNSPAKRIFLFPRYIHRAHVPDSSWEVSSLRTLLTGVYGIALGSSEMALLGAAITRHAFSNLVGQWFQEREEWSSRSGTIRLVQLACANTGLSGTEGCRRARSHRPHVQCDRDLLSSTLFCIDIHLTRICLPQGSAARSRARSQAHRRVNASRDSGRQKAQNQVIQ